MTRYTNLEGRRSLAKKLVDSDSEPEQILDDHAKAHVDVKATEAEAGPSSSPPKKKKRKTSATTATDVDGSAASVSNAEASIEAVESAPSASKAPQEPMTVEKLLKRAKLLKLKAKKAKTDEARKNFQKQTRELERQVEQLHGAFEYGPKGQLIKKGEAQSEIQWQSRQKQDWSGPSSYGGDGGWAGRGGSGFGAGGESSYSHGDEKWKMDRRDERREERAMERQKKLKCFACRGMGHSAKDCPNALDAQSISLKADASTANGTTDAPIMGRDAVGICFRCGSTEHTLSRCRKAPLPADELPFATCFVCGAKGHLSSKCPNNAGKGVYPEGGSCKVCNSVQHLARDCPIVLRREGTSASATGTNSIVVGSASSTPAGGDDDEFHTQARIQATAAAAPPKNPAKTKVITF